MDLFTLDDSFAKKDIVDDFNSVIWTERYSEAGDINLVVPLSQNNIRKFPEGTFLATSSSKEVMICESVLRERDKGTIKITGPSLVKFLNNRAVFEPGSDSTNGTWNLPDPTAPADAIGSVVQVMAVSGGPFGADVNGLPNTTVRSESGGDALPMSIPYGGVYDAIESIAKSFNVGISMYLESSEGDGVFSIVFHAYWGKDRTSDQTVNAPVVFSEQMDTFMHTTELRSIANSKNVLYTYQSGSTEFVIGTPSLFDPTANLATRGYKRRMGVNLVEIPDSESTLSTIHSILAQKSRDAMKDMRPVRMVDGEVPPDCQFKFSKDYGLGDIVEVQNMDGTKSDAQVSEYIRVQDQTGYREYPTLNMAELPGPGLDPA